MIRFMPVVLFHQAISLAHDMYGVWRLNTVVTVLLAPSYQLYPYDPFKVALSSPLAVPMSLQSLSTSYQQWCRRRTSQASVHLTVLHSNMHRLIRSPQTPQAICLPCGPPFLITQFYLGFHLALPFGVCFYPSSLLPVLLGARTATANDA